MNLIVVICHDMGQHMGCYGVPGVRTPSFDEFAEKGIRFENSFCTAPQCSPSRAALWTGRYPHETGVVGLVHAEFGNDLNDGERHLAEILNDAGYDSCLIGFQHVSPSAERCGFRVIDRERRAPQTTPIAEEFLKKKDWGKKPLYLQIGLFEPHRPFPHEDVEPKDPKEIHVLPYLPDIPEVREDLADLEASTSSADKAFGKIVKAIDDAGMTDDTIVLYTTDHGIAYPHAKMTLYDPGIETALLMRIPGQKGGRVFEEMISNVDVVPTILELLGQRIPKNVRGKSFKGLVTGEGYEPNEQIFAEKTYHTYYDPMRAIRTKRWKLIANFEHAPSQESSPDYENNCKTYVEIAKAKPPKTNYHPFTELYDLESDRWEQNNLADDPKHQETKIDLLKRLRQWMKDTNDPLLKGPVAQGCYRKRMKAFLEA